jgi:hypothetical protein
MDKLLRQTLECGDASPLSLPSIALSSEEREESKATMHRRTPRGPVVVVAAMGLLSLTLMAVAQPPASNPSEPTPNPKTPTSLDNLSVEQGKIADKYARLEQLLIRMSELEASNNPQRAALLKRAAQQSSEKLTRQQLNTLIKLLSPPAQLKRAVDDQQQVIADLKALLELLQSENRADRLKSEQTRIKDYIKEVELLIRLQQGIQGRTEGGDDAKKLATDQEKTGDRTGQLAKRIQETEEGAKGSDESKSDAKKDAAENGKSKSSEKGSSDKKEGDPSSKDKNGEKSSPDKKASDNDGKDEPSKEPTEKSADDKSGEKSSDQKSSDQKSSGQKSSGKKSSGDPKKSDGKQSKSQNQGEPSESPESEQSPDSPPQPEQQDQSNPARKRLQEAEERMRDAQKKLSEAKQKDAMEDQELARQKLEEAKAELEQILRQMREEEIERTLAMLEGRFRRMLESQLKVYESTKRLDKIPAAQRNRDIDIQAGKLGFEEGKLAVDADKALLLLREEGSSVAFPETVEMMRDDMQHVADRLSAAQIDRVTQGVEEEIIQTLEELIAALQKAQQDLKDKKPPPPMPQQPMDPSQRPLVDQLAELKMIRSLQLRINSRTQRYAKLLENVDDPVGRANDADLNQSLVKLAEMEKRVHEITRNLVLGKNQ